MILDICFRQVFFSESKQLLVLSVPLIISGLIETSIGFFSNVFLAHLGTESLAAGALVNWVFTTLMVVIWGTLSASTTLVARYYGTKNQEQITCVFYASLFLATLCALPAIFLLWNLSPLFLFFGQKSTLVKLAQPYLHGLAWAIIPDLLITTLLQFAAGLGRTKTSLVFSLLFVPINILFNYSLMFGKFNLPSLGIAGIGFGTALAFWVITSGFILYFFLNKTYRCYFQFPQLQKIRRALKEILHLGLPLGLMYFVEVGFFLALSILMGSISQNTLSANQITLQFFWLFSIVTFALAQGITIQVGHSLGKKSSKSIHYATYLGLFYACCFMLVVGMLYWVFSEELVRIDFNTDNPKNIAIIQLAKRFLAIAGLVQLVEAIRISFFGALRGLKDIHLGLLTSILIFWLIALPLGYLSTNYISTGYGVWWAILFGEIIGTPLMIWQYHRKVEGLYSANFHYVKNSSS